MPFASNEELRIRFDVDPDGNCALRVDVFVETDAGMDYGRGPLWINPGALGAARADFDF